MSLAEGLKKSLHRASPRLYSRLQEAWTSYRVDKITRAIVGRHGLVVQQGPFAGMQYVHKAAGSSLLPKLLGCYEAELHETIAEVFSFKYTRIVDIGCAEGYYAVGLAVQLPDVEVFAFDIDAKARELCVEMAVVNCVADRVFVAGECGSQHLDTLIKDRTLVICDCEGCELNLLDPNVVPSLSSCDVLVELHDFIHRTISSTILSRFSSTHNISLIVSQDRNPDAYAELRDLSDWDKRVAVAEFREERMQWAFMKSRWLHA